MFVVSNPKLTGTDCDKADADHKKFLKKMWDAPVLSKKRVSYEKKAIAAHKLSKKCKTEGVGGREKGYPSLSVPKLWQSDPHKRPLDAGLVVSAVLAGPEVLDIVTAATKGWNPTAAIALEWRAEIAGGLLTLKTLGEKGYEDVDDAALQKLVALTLSKKDNAKLLKMAGEKGNDDQALKAAARRMRAKIAKFGDEAMTYAFGMRGLLMCSAGSIAQALQSTVKAGVWTGIAFIPIVGVAISAVGAGLDAAKIAIAQSIAAAAKTRMEALIRQASEAMAAQAEKKAAEEELKQQKAIEKVRAAQLVAIEAASKKTTSLHSSTSASASAAPTSSNTFLWAGVATIAVLGVVTIVRSRSHS
jgi:hypothetical protein